MVAHGVGGPGGLGSFTATRLRGTWSVTPLPGLPFADSSDLVPSAISCFAQRCMVVGNFFFGQEGEGVFYETAVHGVWHTAHAITFPNGNLYQLEAQSVSCTSHACVIGGGAFTNPGGFAATVTQ